MSSGLRDPAPDALFSLIPVNRKARSVVDDVDNAHLVSSSWKKEEKSFDIGFHINSHYSTNTLATIGRNDCDITLRLQNTSRIHCSFEIDDLETGVVMFYDRSLTHNTKATGKKISNGANFETGRAPRKVLVHPDFNEKISMGGLNGDLIQFTIEWIQTEDDLLKAIARKHWDGQIQKIIDPRKARTFDPTETQLNTPLTTEQAFQKPGQKEVRYRKRKVLGVGTFGTVWRAINVDSGRIMAVKTIDWPPGQLHRLEKAKREVELMRRAKHPRTVELITSQGWDDLSSSVTIFMGVEEDNLHQLSIKGGFELESGRPGRCLQQMLSALDFLAFKDIVHRDVKPENILCSKDGPTWNFRLSDFGIGKIAK